MARPNGALLRAETVILGAGLAGLSIAYHLEMAGKDDYLVVERQQDIGGICGTKACSGFLLDYGPHLFFTKDPYVVGLMQKLLKGNLLTRKSDPWQHAYGTYGKYPYTVNMRWFPKAIRDSCIAGFRDAWHRKQEDQKAGILPRVSSYLDWCYYHYGKGFAELFMLKYARKYWTVEPSELTTGWIGDKIYVPSLAEVEGGARKDLGRSRYYYTTFRYPKRGGAGALTKAFYGALPPERVRFACGVASIDIKRKQLRLEDGRVVGYRNLVSTIALPALVRMINTVPQGIRGHSARLRATQVLCVLIGTDSRDQGRKGWIYFDEPGISFFRLSFPRHFSPFTCPPGKSSVWAEVSFPSGMKVDVEATVGRVTEDLRRLGILKGRIVAVDHAFAPFAYPIYDQHWEESVGRITQYLRQNGIEVAGRFGRWEYLWTHQVILQSRDVAEKL